MNHLCCLISGTFNCGSCQKSLCEKHMFGRQGHFGYSHKVQRCLQCHRSFVQSHRTGSTKMISFATWFNQVSRRQKKQGKKVVERPLPLWPF